ncbi:glycosyltransferase family 39 protein [Patescibacteria group bacterium]|nr:glycosyltransferase family 39 protein [Patescibacteria group bacterium]
MKFQLKKEHLILIILLVLAAFLRFYKLADYMNFLGDEGRDALIVKDILVGHHIPLLGPPTSVGNVYLGPLYYYMMAVAMGIVWLNPVAAAGMVALIGVLTIFLIYYLAKRWFGIVPASLTAFLYTVSPITITASRSSWNPNPAPFFTLLAFLTLDQARKSKNFIWFGLAGVFMAAAAQMHYLALILIPIFGCLWIYELVRVIQNKGCKHFIWGTVLSITGFIIVMLPLVVFDLRHNLMNYHAMVAMFSQSGSAVNFNLLQTFAKIVPIYNSLLIGRYLAAENTYLTYLLAALVLAPIIYEIYRIVSKKTFSWPYFALTIWLLVGLIGMSFYQQAIFDHYLAFLSPAPYLLLAALLALLKKYWRYSLLTCLVILICWVSLPQNILLRKPNKQLQRTQEIAKFVIAQASNQPFNFALIAKNNYDAAYQYYLDLYGHQPGVVPAQITDQLFVVCEDEVCQPVNNPKYEIAGFGWAKIDQEYLVDGLKIYRLVHNPSGK